MPFDAFQLTKNCVMFSKTNWIIWKDLKSVYFNSIRAFESYTEMWAIALTICPSTIGND